MPTIFLKVPGVKQISVYFPLQAYDCLFCHAWSVKNGIGKVQSGNSETCYGLSMQTPLHILTSETCYGLLMQTPLHILT